MNMRIKVGMICLIMALTGCMNSARDEKEKKPAVKLSYSKDIALNPEKFWSDDKLKDIFSAYWGLRFAKKSKELFEMEAPYFQTTANFDRYRGLTENIQDQLTEIELRERVQVTERLVRIRCVIHLTGKEGNKSVPLLDQWVYVGGKWYHVWRDSLFFPNES